MACSAMLLSVSCMWVFCFFFFSSRRRHTRFDCDWSSDVCSSDLSTFIFPAIVDRSPIVVAVGSAGHAPVLARRVREQIEALLPERLGALARFMGARRKAVRRALGAFARRGFWERIAAGPVPTLLLPG